MFDRLKDERGEGEARFAVPGIVVVILIVWGAVALFTGFEKTPQDKIGLSYGGGPIEGEKFQRVVDPGSGLFFNGLFDRLYEYPVTQRNYIISLNPNEGDVGTPDSITAPTNDNVVVEWEVATYFKLNLSKLQEFHERIGRKYAAWCEGDNQECSEGWVQMLHDSFRQQIENALQLESRQFDAAAVFSDEQVILEIQRGVGSVLKERVAEVLGGDYFCGPGYVLGGTECPDVEFVVKAATLPEEVVAAFRRNRTSEIEIETKENEVRQAEFQAQAIERLAAALKNAGPSYVLLKAIESGRITFWVIPQNGGPGLTIPGPQI